MKKVAVNLLLIFSATACQGTATARLADLPRYTLHSATTFPVETKPPVPTQGPTDLPTTAPLPSPTLWVEFEGPSGQAQGLLPEFQDELSDLESATRYWIEVQVEFASENAEASIEGEAQIRYTNNSTMKLDEIVLMLWPNQEQYQAEMTVGPLLVNGEQVGVEFGEANLFLRASLEPAVQPGGYIDLSLPFEVLASGTIGEIGLKRFGISYSIFAAPTFYPLIPRRVNGAWQVDRAVDVGDTTNSDIAFYKVTVTAPGDLDLITSGVEVAALPSTSGKQTKTFVSGPMRDFAFVIGPFERIERNVEGVDLIGWVLPGHLEDGEIMMEAAGQQFSLLNGLVGPYPYPELDLVDVPGGFGGIEYPGLVFIGTLGEVDIVDPTVHEVAHQWFYGLIGNDQLIEPWLDEGAARFGQVLYYENFVGSGRAMAMLNYDRAQLWQHPNRTLPIGMDISSYGSPQDYVLFVYSKGALFFDQLRSTLGEETFLKFLQNYYDENRYGFVTSEGFQELAEQTCACDLDNLFDLWVFEGGEMILPGE